MSSQEASAATDTFLDRWGHWVLWMGPYILIVSLLAWTPRLIPLMVGIEAVQFIVHVSRHHPEHPMTDVLPLFVAGVILTFSGVLIPSTMGVWLLVLLVTQGVFSSAVHRWIHRGVESDRGRLLIDLVGSPILSAVMIIVMIMDETVPGLPLLRAFLL